MPQLHTQDIRITQTILFVLAASAGLASEVDFGLRFMSQWLQGKEEARMAILRQMTQVPSTALLQECLASAEVV